MAGANTLVFTDTNFEEQALKASVPVLVDFWAEWCGPCRKLGPTIDELADQFAGKALIGKMDTDGNRSTPLKYGVQSIPTVILLRNGQLVKKFVGLQRKDDLAAAISAAM